MCTQNPIFYQLHCDADIDSILTAIYDAFVLKKQLPKPYRDNIHISIGEYASFDLFSKWIEVTTNTRKAALTMQAIQTQLGPDIYMAVLRSLCHYDADRATIVLGFLVRAFSRGRDTLQMLSDPYVMGVMELSRKVANESYRFLEILRFKQIEQTLYARIEPKCNVLPLICNHFQERFPRENWIIYDAVHHLGSVHSAGEDWILVADPSLDIDLTAKHPEDEFIHLWKVFFSTIAIKERENPRCQNTLLAKWYRKNMVEFEDS